MKRYIKCSINNKQWVPYDLNEWDNLNGRYEYYLSPDDSIWCIVKDYTGRRDDVSTRWEVYEFLDDDVSHLVGKGVTDSYESSIDRINGLINRSQNLQDTIQIGR